MIRSRLSIAGNAVALAGIEMSGTAPEGLAGARPEDSRLDAPMAPKPSQHRRSRLLPILVLIAAAHFVAQRPAFAEEIYTDDLPDWIPSFAVGAGIYSRDADGVAEGEIRSDAGTDSERISCVNDPDSPLRKCTIFTKGTEAVDGFTLQLQGSLMGPAWEDGPWRPRPFIQGGYGYPFKKRRVTTQGEKKDDFDSNGQEADIRVELIGKPQHFWWMGGGVAFELPVETYPTWIKFGVNYIRDKTDALGRVTQPTDVDASQRPADIITNQTSKGLDLDNIGPSFGIESLVARWGPLALGVSADFFVGFPIGSTKKRFSTEAPGFADTPGGPVFYKYDADSPWFFGNAALRIVWIGDPD